MATIINYFASYSLILRIIIFLAIAILSHLLVRGIRKFTAHWAASLRQTQRRKMMSILSLLTSTLVFIIYFATAGFILREFGVPIGTYFASATIIGLAVGFGSQGLVQDVVSCLTVIFSDVFDVGDLVEIGGQVGVIKSTGLRFVEVENPMGAKVLIPNRSVTNVINYYRGYIRCIVDITIPESMTEEQQEQLTTSITNMTNGVYQQFQGIHIRPPSVEGIQSTEANRKFIRVKFRIWPGRGMPIEQSFKQEVISSLKNSDKNYSEWMVSVHYEVEKRA